MRGCRGVYDLATLFVTAVPDRQPVAPSFAPAPAQDGLTELAVQLVRAVVAKGTLGERVDVWSKIGEAPQ